MNLCVGPGVDFLLVVFYLFVAYDLSHARASGGAL
jgi:hypothetical protein